MPGEEDEISNDVPASFGCPILSTTVRKETVVPTAALDFESFMFFMECVWHASSTAEEIENDDERIQFTLIPSCSLDDWSVHFKATFSVVLEHGTKMEIGVTESTYEVNDRIVSSSNQSVATTNVRALIEGGFRNAKKIVNLEIELTVISYTGIRPRLEYIFDDTRHPLADVVFIAEGQRVALPSQVMSLHCRWIRENLYDRAGRPKKELTLTEGVTHSAFVKIAESLMPMTRQLEGGREVLEAARLIGCPSAINTIDDKFAQEIRSINTHRCILAYHYDLKKTLQSSKFLRFIKSVGKVAIAQDPLYKQVSVETRTKIMAVQIPPNPEGIFVPVA